MSGGVDSSVAAALLVEQGYQVSGAFMKNWTDCDWQADKRDATRVAAKLDIPFTVFDFEKEYRARVVDYLFREYAANRTPNPDVMCNKEIKFKLFLNKALELGFDYIATGHYARVKKVKDEYQLLAGKDPNKDQSYFLCELGQRELSHALFPIGEYRKSQVRELAKKYDLPTAEKKDSQGICFIGEVNVQEFLKSKLSIKPGKIVTDDSLEVGMHDGVWFYTIGQRHGFHSPGGGMPYYVVDKDAETNTLIVSKGETKKLYKNELRVADLHWVSGNTPVLPLTCQARIRYRQPLEKVTLTVSHDIATARFQRPQRAVTPGQFIVFYQGDVLLGAGVIV